MILPARENLIEALLALRRALKRITPPTRRFPGEEAAHFLRKALAEKVHSFIPPAILSMDEFVNWVYEKKEACLRNGLSD
jgi:hypothetical protein